MLDAANCSCVPRLSILPSPSTLALSILIHRRQFPDVFQHVARLRQGYGGQALQFPFSQRRANFSCSGFRSTAICDLISFVRRPGTIKGRSRSLVVRQKSADSLGMTT